MSSRVDALFWCTLVSALLARHAAAKPQARERGDSGASRAVYNAPEPEEAPAPALPEKVLADVSRAVVLLERLDAEGRYLGSASAFVIKPGFVITNRHCIEGASSIKINLGEGGLVDVKGLAAQSENLDVVFLKAAFPEPGPAMLDWAPEMPHERTAIAIVVRDPRGKVTASLGWTRSPDFESGTGGLVLESSAPAWMGCSGSPMVDHQGRVVGVVSRLGGVMPGQMRTTGSAAICDDVRLVKPSEAIRIDRVAGIAGASAQTRSLLAMADGMSERVPAEAERYFLQARAADPDSRKVAIHYAYFLMMRRQSEKARDVLADFVKQHPSDIPARLYLGHTILGTGNWRDAIQAYEELLSVDPGFAAAWFWKGMAQWYAMDLTEAAVSLEKAIKFEPRHAKGLQSLARLYQGLNRPDDWRRVVRLWCTQRPTDEEPLEQLVAATAGPDFVAERNEAIRKLRALSPFAANRSIWQQAPMPDGLKQSGGAK